MRATLLTILLVMVPVFNGTSANAADGRDIYDNYCALCHNKGMLDAPRFGEKRDWKKRWAKGEEALMASAVDGLNNMPAKGGYKRVLSDEDVNAATGYLLQSVR
jgi:cytochrome c5